MNTLARIAVGLVCVPWLASAQVRENVDWSAFLGRHDLVWEELPKAWHEGAFIGNGLLGAMIYAESTNALQWDINRSDVADRGGRLQIGRFELAPAGGGEPRGTMRLELWNAEARGELRTGSAALAWRSFVHTDRPVAFIEITEKGAPSGAQLAYVPLPAVPARDDYKKTPVPEKERNPAATGGETEGVHWSLQPFKAGGGYCVAWAERTLAPGHRLLAWTIDYAPAGAPAAAQAVADVRDALRADFDGLVKSHRDGWHAYWPRSFVSFPDTRMESFYWIQMYKLASGTRADAPALDLMGPWFRRTPWPKIWWNLNIQLTYWPVYAANRLDLGESLTRMLDANVTNLVNNVPEAWRSDSAAIARTSTYDCRGGVGGKDGEERGNLIWTMHNYWLQCRCSGDEGMLRERFYPLLKRTVGYYLHLLKPGDDGRLHLPVSLSPEYPKTAPDTNYDLALLRWGLQTVIACDARFKGSDPFASRCRETLAKLAAPPVDPQHGFMIGAGQPLEISHRHFSHLFAIYPLHLLDFDAPADRALAEKSLDYWIGFEGALQGYSFTGASAMSSWLGRRGANVKLLNEFLDRFVKANTMYLEAGPVIETPLAGAAAIHEVLLQSWTPDSFGTQIRVLPALPDDWKDATIHRLLAEGAFEVSASRRDGRTRFVQLKSLAGNPCVVRTGLDEPVALNPSRAFEVKTTQDRNGNPLTTIDLKKGETIVLVSAKHPAAPEELVIAPVAPQPGRSNYYGSKKTAPVAQAADGSLTLGAREAKLGGSALFVQGKGEDANIGHWTVAGEYVGWKIAVAQPGSFKVHARYAATGAGNRFVVEVRDAAGAVVSSVEAERQGSGGFDRFQELELGALKIPTAGNWEIRMRSADGKAPMLNLSRLNLLRN